MLHPDLSGVLAAIDAVEKDANQLVTGLSDEQVNWRPSNSGWSIAQCLDHLSKMNPFYARHFLSALEKAQDTRPFRGLSPTWLGAQFVKSLEPPPKRMRAKAPKSLTPAESMPAATLLGQYVRSHDDYRRLVEKSNEVDVNLIVTNNPFFQAIRMRVATALLVIPAHDRRHIWQARQVLQAPGFPK